MALKRQLKVLSYMIGTTLVLLELGLRLTTSFWMKNLEIKEPTRYVITSDGLKNATKIFDDELGWITKPDTSFGERKRPINYRKPLLVSFGDSFVFGDEVRDHETWQSQLAERTKNNVYNFGVGGYGPDQAYLRFQRFVKQAQGDPKNAPFISLGVTIENINRIVNIYRKFYLFQTGLPMTKPHATLENDSLKFISNPIQNPNDLIKLQDPKFIQFLGENDYWYSKNSRNYILLTPYFLNLLVPKFWQRLQGSSSGDISGPIDLWADQKTVKIMKALLNQFKQDVVNLGAIPIITIFPRRQDILLARQGPHSSHEVLRNVCLELKLNCFDGIEFLSKQLANEDINSIKDYWLAGGHPSPITNKFIAQGLEEYMKMK